MANFIITNDITWGLFIAGIGSTFAHGDDITINSNVKLTIDISPTFIIGKINVYGTLFVDGSINDIIFLGNKKDKIITIGQGKFLSVGKWLSVGITDGTTNQIINTPHKHTPGLWVETGRHIPYTNENTMTVIGQDNYSPQIDDYVCLTTDTNKPFGQIKQIGIGYIVVDAIHTGTVNNLDTLCIVKDTKKWTLDRGWNVVWTAIVSGNHIPEPNIYTRWHNANGNKKTITDYTTGWGCNTFDQTFNSAITLPDGTQGNLPPVGCNIKIPNVYFGTGDKNNGTELNIDKEKDRYRVETQSAGIIQIDYTNLGGVYFKDIGSSKWDMSHCLIQLGFGGDGCNNDSVYDDIIVVHSANNNKNPEVLPNNTYNKLIIKNATFSPQQDATYNTKFDSNISVELYNTEWISHNKKGNGGVTLATNLVKQFSAKNTLLACGFGFIDGVDEVLFDTLLIRPAADNTSNKLDYCLNFNNTSGMITNAFNVSEGDIFKKEVIKCFTSTKMKIRNFGLLDNEWDLFNQSCTGIGVTGLSSIVDVARCYFKNTKDIVDKFTDVQCDNIVFTDCNFGFTFGYNKRNTNLTLDNVAGNMSSSYFSNNAVTSFMSENFSANGQHQLYGRYSLTNGVVYTLGVAPSTNNEYQISASPDIIFHNNGKCSGITGSELFIYGQNKIRGVTSFSGLWQEANNNLLTTMNTHNFTGTIVVQYAIKSEIGNPGIWKDISAINLTNEVVDPSGFILDIKLRWVAPGDFIALGIDYNTDNVTQLSNLKTIDLPTISTDEVIRNISYANNIWLSTMKGINSIKYPYGTQYNGCRTLKNAMALVVPTTIQNIKLEGNLSLTENVDNINFYNWNNAHIDLNNQLITNTSFNDMQLSGICNGNIIANNCSISNITNLLGDLNNCTMTSTLITLSSGNHMWFDCISNNQSSLVIDVASGGIILDIREWYGDITIINSTDVNNKIMINGSISNIIISPSCTTGSFKLSGNISIVNNSTLNISHSLKLARQVAVDNSIRTII